MESIDKFDLAILQELQTDVRLTNAELAQRVDDWHLIGPLSPMGPKLMIQNDL